MDAGTLAVRTTISSISAPAGVAVDDQLGLAVVANPQSNQVTIIDLTRTTPSVVKTISVGGTPFSVDINGNTHVAVVSDSSSFDLSLIDLKKQAVVATIPNVVVGSDSSQAVAVHSGTNVAVVANTSLNTITLVDLGRQTIVKAITVGSQPYAVAVNPQTNIAVVANSTDSTMTVVNLGTGQTSTAALSFTKGVAIHVASNTAVVARSVSNEVDYLDLSKSPAQVVGTISSLSTPTAVAVNQAGRQAAVALPSFNKIAVTSLPLLNRLAIVNGASFQATSLAPGSIASAFSAALAASTLTAPSVPLPVTLGETSLLVGSVQAPLFYVSNSQVNFQVPVGLTGSQTVTVLRKNVTVASGTLTIASVSPALFTQAADGSGPVAALNEDGSVVSASGCITGAKPAAPGSAVMLFGTGEGDLTPLLATGAAAPVTPPSVTPANPTATLGGVPVSVEFSGAAPGFVGLWQINIRIPSNPSSGPAVPLVVTLGGQSSQAGVTLAVNTSVVTCTH